MRLFFVIAFFFASLAHAQAAYDFVQTSGEGEIKIKPDLVTLNVTVYSRAASAKQAQQENAKEMARVDKLLKTDFKIDPKDIQTSNFQVTPQYEYVKDKSVYKGMSVTHSLFVRLHKVDEIGNLLDHLSSGQTQEGFGVRIEDINFSTDQFRTYQTQALESAMSDAKARAQVLAKAANRNLGIARKVIDSRVSFSPVQPLRGMGKATFASMSEDAPSTQLSAGEISVKAQVQVEYEIK